MSKATLAMLMALMACSLAPLVVQAQPPLRTAVFATHPEDGMLSVAVVEQSPRELPRATAIYSHAMGRTAQGFQRQPWMARIVPASPERGIGVNAQVALACVEGQWESVIAFFDARKLQAGAEPSQAFLRKFSIAGQVRSFVFSRNGQRIYAADAQRNTVHCLNAVTGEELAPAGTIAGAGIFIPPGYGIVHVYEGPDGYVYITSGPGLAVLNPQSLSVAKVINIPTTWGMDFANNKAYVTSESQDRVMAINSDDSPRVAGAVSWGSRPGLFRVSPDQKSAVIANRYSKSVVLDLESNQTREIPTLGAYWYALTLGWLGESWYWVLGTATDRPTMDPFTVIFVNPGTLETMLKIRLPRLIWWVEAEQFSVR